jgi:phage terminase large subunit-like protein
LKNYVAIATRYAEQVVAGKITACKWVRLACQRQLDDLARSDWQYKFDKKKANRICAFVEGLPHIKGEWAKRRQKLILEPWQCFIYTTVFGWIDSKTDLRRFRIAYNEMGRKNGKSAMSAPVGAYMLCADGEQGAEVYSAATTRDQAKIVWEAAKMMVEREPGLRDAFGVETSAHSIYQTSTASRFQALSAEGNSLDGLNIHCAIVDELHAHQTPKVYNVIESSRGSRSQPLIWIITTAGFDQSGVCFQQRNYVTQILSGAVKDENYFGVIYTLDEGDNWQDEANWAKSNPNLGVSVFVEEMRMEARKAAKMPSALNNFLTKRLCTWVTASVNLFNLTKWKSTADASLTPEAFKKDQCWLGLDFAPRNDFSSICQLFRREEDDGSHYYAFFRHFLSEGKVEESENASYAGWAREGLITTCSGNQTDPDDIEDALIEIYESGYQVQELDCDPSRTQGIEQHVEKRTGGLVVEILQRPSTMCMAAEKLSALIADGKLHHTGDQLTTWMLSNVVGRKKGNWGLFPDKERDENKIDGITALMIALSRAMVNEAAVEPQYQAFIIGA